jgi:2-isopropylmalate synthase
MSDAVDPTRVLVFDTTLRDGEQSPGISLNAQEKLEIAQQLARLGVDVIEAGFPITSPGDFEAVREISRNVDGPVICALARTVASDIDRAWEAVRDAARPRIHMVIATSDLHIEHKLQTTREDVLGQARAAVAHAKGYVDDVEFSCEDGFRSDREFMAEVISATIAEGATTINVADTVGYATPEEYAGMFTELYERVPALRDVVVSVHCHNDLGVAVANSLAGLQAGCRQVECAINGLGERAGNASLEEIVMLLHTRAPYLGLTTGVDTTEIARTSRLVSRLTGYPVQPNKAIVGRNAFAHESGIHQDGVLKERTTYEIKEIADKKKQVTAMDLEALVTDDLRDETAGYELEWFDVEASSRRPPHATVGVRTPDGQEAPGSFTGDGPVDAIFHAINAAAGVDARLREFRIDAVTAGRDALGETSVVLEVDGVVGSGQGVSTDILEAAGRAYVRALSNALRRQRIQAEPEVEAVPTP